MGHDMAREGSRWFLNAKLLRNQGSPNRISLGQVLSECGLLQFYLQCGIATTQWGRDTF
jgi:hypothetical protein